MTLSKAWPGTWRRSLRLGDKLGSLAVSISKATSPRAVGHCTTENTSVGAVHGRAEDSFNVSHVPAARSTLLYSTPAQESGA